MTEKLPVFRAGGLGQKDQTLGPALDTFLLLLFCLGVLFCFVLLVFNLDYVRPQKQEANEGRMKRRKIFSQPN